LNLSSMTLLRLIHFWRVKVLLHLIALWV